MQQVHKKTFFTLFTLSLLAALWCANAALPRSVSGQQLPSLAPVLKDATPAVVNIATKGEVDVPENPLMNDPIFRYFFKGQKPQPQKRKTQSLGSGVIIDAVKGYVLTNYHVIRYSTEITVTLNDGRELSANLIGSDPESDIALIQIPASGIKALPLANSDELQVGDFVVAIGNPFGLGQTVTSGIVSALGRTGLGIEGYEDFIQTDASINPGNSGGALINLHGELVGINTAILAPNGGNVGIGFAIPVNMAKTLVAQIIQHGDVQRGILGVSTQDFTPELAKAFNIDFLKGGALVREISPGSPAEKAGLRPGDIILQVNGRPIKDGTDVRNRIGLLRAGSIAQLTVYRNGINLTVKAKVEAPQELTIEGDRLHPNLKGATFGSAEKIVEGQKGVVILSVNRASSAWKTGLRQGDLILSANRIKVNNATELEEAISRTGRSLLLHIRRGREAFYLVIR